MTVETSLGLKYWIAQAGYDALSPFTRDLVARVGKHEHAIVRAEPQYQTRGEYGLSAFDPRVVCLAVEGMVYGNGPEDKNIRNAKRLLEWTVSGSDHIVTEGHDVSGLEVEEMGLPENTIFSFLRGNGKADERNISFADYMEARQEMDELYSNATPHDLQRMFLEGRPPHLHRIEEREEAIASRLWQILQQVEGRVYLVLETPHILSLNRHPTDVEGKRNYRGERDRYLLYDFMEEERIPHVVVAPQIPLKFTGGVVTEQLAREWEGAIHSPRTSRGCVSYTMDNSYLDRQAEFIEGLPKGLSEADMQVRTEQFKEEDRRRWEETLNRIKWGV